jgi:hypothetical protein
VIMARLASFKMETEVFVIFVEHIIDFAVASILKEPMAGIIAVIIQLFFLKFCSYDIWHIHLKSERFSNTPTYPN